MLQLINNTPFHAERAALVDNEGNQVWVVVVKATYFINEDGTITEHPQPEPVHLFPQYSGDLATSHLLRDGELVFNHPGTDISVLASAYAPNKEPVRALNVSVSVGPITKTLRVFGDRYWHGRVSAPSISPPEPFVTLPVSYERAFGGTVILADAPDGREREPRNPIGRGFASSVKALISRPLPNIEEPNHLIHAWDDRPYPVGFGPIPAMWSPRLGYAGTFDDQWRQQRMPLLPSDYNPRYTQAAHPDLVSQEPLRGGEQVVLTNLTPSGVMRFVLPRVYLIFTTSTVTGTLRQGVQLDRVIIEPDAKKLVMVWRSSLNCASRVRNVVSTVVELKPYLPRAVASAREQSDPKRGVG